MITPESDRLLEISNLILNYKLEKALNEIKKIEQKKNLTKKESIECQILKCTITCRSKTDFQENLEKIDLIINDCYERGYKLQEFDSYIIKAEILTNRAEKEENEVKKIIKKCKNLLDEIQDIDKELLLQRKTSLQYRILDLASHTNKANQVIKEANKLLEFDFTASNRIYFFFTFIKLANCYLFKGELNKAYDFFIKSLEPFESIEYNKGIMSALNGLGIYHKYKGEYSKAIHYFTRLEKLATKMKHPKGIAATLLQIGEIYFYKNELHLAYNKCKESYVKYSKKELKDHIDDKATVLYYLILITLNLKLEEESNAYMFDLEYLNKTNPNKITKLYWKLAKAKILIEKDDKLENRIEAKKILNLIIKEKTTLHLLTIRAMVELCILYLIDLEIVRNDETLKKIENLISKIENVSQKQKQAPFVVEAKFLKAQFVFLYKEDIEEATKILNEAKELARKKQLFRLESKIDDLLLYIGNNQITKSMFEFLFRDTLSTLSREVRKTSHFHKLISSEEPIAIIINSKEGQNKYNYIFSDKIRNIEGLNQRLLNTAYAISENFVPGEIEREIDEIIMNDVIFDLIETNELLFIYCYSGRFNFKARERMHIFIERIYENKKIIDDLISEPQSTKRVKSDISKDIFEIAKNIFQRDIKESY